MNKFNLQPFIRVCQIVCFILAGYMVYIQFLTYFDNQNVSNTEYRRFKDGNEEIYPTFSICAVGGLKLILRETATFFSPNQNAIEYEKILKGKRNGTLDYDKIRLDQVVMDINDLITKFVTTTSDNKKILKKQPKDKQPTDANSGRNDSNSILEISHYDPNRVCVTKTDFQTNSLVAKDLIEIEMGEDQAKRLRKGNIDLDFYVHQKGQLLRRLKYPHFHLDRKNIVSWMKQYKEMEEKNRHTQARYKVTMNIVSVDVIRKRSDYVIPCHPNLRIEDNKIRRSIMTKFGCIPAFMVPFVDESCAVETFQPCNQTQYAKIDEMGSGFIQAQELYTPPCIESNSIVTATEGTALISKKKAAEGRLTFELHYSSDIYREAVSVTAFDFATLWSQIGGFIGIFLGYSLMQVPELAQQCIARIKTLLKNF